jgi:hypothetical protein
MSDVKSSSRFSLQMWRRLLLFERPTCATTALGHHSARTGQVLSCGFDQRRRATGYRFATQHSERGWKPLGGSAAIGFGEM